MPLELAVAESGQGVGWLRLAASRDLPAEVGQVGSEVGDSEFLAVPPAAQPDPGLGLRATPGFAAQRDCSDCCVWRAAEETELLCPLACLEQGGAKERVLEYVSGLSESEGRLGRRAGAHARRIP